MSEMNFCPLCRLQVQMEVHPSQLWTTYKCLCCGTFEISPATLSFVSQLDDVSFISGFTRHRSTPTLAIILDRERIAEAKSNAPTDIWERSKLLLREIEKQSRHFGDVVSFNTETDYPLAYAKNQEEFRSLLKLLSDSGFIESCSPTQFVLKADGIRELESWRKSNAQSEKVFVAMSFATELRPVYDSCIDPTIRRAGYRPIRIDLEEHNEDIVARVLMEIREARFVVADFTGHRNGVYFEAGFAKGLGLEVIWLCRSDDIGKAHFDTQHFNHVVWSSEDELKGKLLSRIVATVGPGPLKKESVTS